MKKINKIVAFLCMGLTVAGCNEDELISNTQNFTPGKEIVFGAIAETESAKSRTVYGDLNDSKNLIEVNWVTGDKLEIASPQTSTLRAEYKVTGIAADNTGFVEKHAAATLEKLGETGLQWGTGTDYTFYAMYPSYSQLEEEGESLANVELSTDGTLIGYLPTMQNPKTVVEKKDGGYMIAPNMSYAYMVAKEEYSTTKLDESGNTVANDEKINLDFTSLVTALQFDITANTIGQQSDGTQNLTITSVSLYSKSGLEICGNFKYDYNTNQSEAANTATGFNRVTMEFSDGYTLSKGEYCDVTFFILPTEEPIPAEDLKLQVFFEVGGTTQVRTATINTAITPRKKYCFNDLLLPEIKADVTGSSWFSALDPNTYISQLSIPVAGNAFSSYYAGGDEQYNKEQVKTYQELWNLGIRGFEFCTALGNTDGIAKGTLEDEYFVCNGQEMNANNAPTFGDAFRYLENMLGVREYEKECLVIIATYKSFSGDGGFNPAQYVKDLEAFIEANADIKNRLVKLTPTSTVGDLQGKIAIIVRPSDDEYIDMDGLEYPVATNTNLTIVNNWGSSVDCWDRRFGSSYARQKVFSQGGSYVEDYLYGVSTSESTFTAGKDFTGGYPTVDNFNFSFNDGDFHIQEFARVVPENTTLQNGFYANVSDYTGIFNRTYRYLWVKWPESYNQKTAMIDATLTASQATKGGSDANTVFINSLCGYYVTTDHHYSYLPYAGDYQYDSYKFSCDKAGMGGDIAGLSADLNTYFYNKLKEVEGTDKQGPLGLVMMNYIGASDTDFSNSEYVDASSASVASTASAALPNLIFMNNFKFPLATKNTTEDSQTVEYNASYKNNANAISFE